MNDYGRRIVVNLGFEAAVGELAHAIHEEGMQVIARIDLRDHFWRHLGQSFRQYVLLEAWSPAPALEALRLDPGAGTILSTTFAAYELADGGTAVVATEALLPAASRPDWRQQAPALAAIADQEGERVAGVFIRLQQSASRASRS